MSEMNERRSFFGPVDLNSQRVPVPFFQKVILVGHSMTKYRVFALPWVGLIKVGPSNLIVS